MANTQQLAKCRPTEWLTKKGYRMPLSNRTSAQKVAYLTAGRTQAVNGASSYQATPDPKTKSSPKESLGSKLSESILRRLEILIRRSTTSEILLPNCLKQLWRVWDLDFLIHLQTPCTHLAVITLIWCLLKDRLVSTGPVSRLRFTGERPRSLA